MEILNRNQRRSALWRVTALLGLFVAAVVVVLFSMNSAQEKQGSGEINESRGMIDSLQVSISILKLEYRNDTLRLKERIAELEGDNELASELEELEAELKKCDDKLEKRDEEIYDLDREIAKLKIQVGN